MAICAIIPFADDKYAIETVGSTPLVYQWQESKVYTGTQVADLWLQLLYSLIRTFIRLPFPVPGNHDNSIYNRGWGECYNGVKEVEKVVKDSLGNETKEYEYKFSVKSNAEIAKNLKGHLMLVTGDMDKMLILHTLIV